MPVMLAAAILIVLLIVFIGGMGTVHGPAIGSLCLRGAESDLVLPDVVAEMRTRGPGTRGRLRVVEVPGCGHAPALNVPEQLDLVAGFIDQHEHAPQCAAAVSA